MKTLKRLAAVFTVMAIALCGSGNSVSAYQWKKVMQDTTGNGVSILALSGSNLVAATDTKQEIFVSADKGASWKKAVGLPADSSSLTVIGPNIIANRSDALFISRDNGESWSKVINGLPSWSLSVKSLTVIGSNIIANTLVDTSNVLFISRDNGESWNKITGLPSNIWVESLTVIKSNIIANGYNVFFISRDNGESWRELTGLPAYVIAVNGSYALAQIDNKNLFLSSDSGESWKEIPLPSGSISRYAITISGTNIIAGTSQGFFLSDDNGTSWKKTMEYPEPLYLDNFTVSGSFVIVSARLTASGYKTFFISSDNGTAWKEAPRFSDDKLEGCTASGSNIIATTYSKGIFVSSDKGETWKKAAIGLPDAQLQITAKKSPYIFAAASRYTYSRYTYLSEDDGTSWKEVRVGLSDTSVNAFAVSAAGIFAATGKGIFLSADNGESWTEKTVGNVTALAARGADVFGGVSAHPSGWLAVTPPIVGIYLSSDNGTSWTRCYNPDSSFDIYALFINGDTVLGGFGYGVYLSADNGKTWEQTFYPPVTVVSFAVRGTDIFAGTYSTGAILSGNTWTYQAGIATSQIYVILSGDNGKTWTAAANTGLPSNAYINALAVSGSYLFAGTSKGVYVSSDNGTNWTHLTSDVSVNALAVSGSHLFGATDTGIFVSRDNGRTWENTGLDKSVKSLVIKGAKLFAGTSSGSEIWVSDFPADCLNIGDDLTFDIFCAEYQGKKYTFTMNYSPDPADPSGLFWKMDATTFRETQAAGNCISVGDNPILNISCAQFRGKKYGFVLNYTGDLRWKMDVGTFSEK